VGAEDQNRGAIRIVFAGTPEFAVPTLEAVHAAGHEIAAVFTQPDRPAGRGRHPQPPAVKRAALDRGLPVHQPEGFDAAARGLLTDLRPELMLVIAYGLLLPPPVLALPRLGCVNLHASLLPRWRGAAPIQRAILAGDTETGITLMQMDEGLDTGPMLARRALAIGPRETGGGLHDRLATLAAELAVESLPALGAGRLRPETQPEAGACHAPKLSRAEAAIDWRRRVVDIDRAVRAFNPWPVAYSRWRGNDLRILEAEPAEGSGPPGEVIAADGAGPRVAAADGALRLLRVQQPGRRPVSGRDAVNAGLRVAERLGQD
jgi:methionyl-tRNA formyltransferase